MLDIVYLCIVCGLVFSVSFLFFCSKWFLVFLYLYCNDNFSGKENNTPWLCQKVEVDSWRYSIEVYNIKAPVQGWFKILYVLNSYESDLSTHCSFPGRFLFSICLKFIFPKGNNYYLWNNLWISKWFYLKKYFNVLFIWWFFCNFQFWPTSRGGIWNNFYYTSNVSWLSVFKIPMRDLVAFL